MEENNFEEIFDAKETIFYEIDKVQNPKPNWHTINFSDARKTYQKSVLCYNKERDSVVFIMFDTAYDLQEMLGITSEVTMQIMDMDEEGGTITVDGNIYLKLW